jgi:signal transduction histidine kinase
MKKISVMLIAATLAVSAPLFAQYSDHRNRQIDSLEQLTATGQLTEEESGAVYLDLAWEYSTSDREKSLAYAQKVLDISIPVDGWQAVTDAYGLMGIYYNSYSEYDKALLYFNHALDAAERMRDFPEKYSEGDVDNMLSYIYGNMANTYNYQGMLHEAVEYYLKSLVLLEIYGWRENEAHVYYNLGEMYAAMRNYPQAENYYRLSKEIAEELGNGYIIASADSGLGEVELHRKNYDLALEYILAAHDYYFTHPEEEDRQVSILNILGRIYLKGYGELSQAETYVRQAMELSKTHDDVMTVTRATSLSILAEIHIERGEWHEAKQSALASLALDDKEFSNALPVYAVLTKAYSHLGDATLADEYFDRHDSLQTSWANRDYQAAIRDMEEKYETEKKEARIATLENEKQLMIWFSVAAVTVLLLALATFFFLWRLSVQKKRIVATQALLDGETAERVRLARDLHDGLGSMLTGIRLSLENMRHNGIGDIAQSLDMLGESMIELRRISHHLMPEALESEGLKPALAAFCRSLPGVKFGWFGSDKRVEPKQEVVIYRIIHELVNNALKHARASEISVQVMREADYIALTVRDNGIGFDPAAESPGMGLHNIRNRVSSGGGRILVDSHPGEGTEININFSLK